MIKNGFNYLPENAKFVNYHSLLLLLFVSSHITLQPRTGCPLKLCRVEPGQYLDGRSPEKTRLLLEEVLVRPAGGAHPVWVLMPQYSDGDTILSTTILRRLNRGPDSLWSLKIPGCPSKESRGVTPASWPN